MRLVSSARSRSSLAGEIRAADEHRQAHVVANRRRRDGDPVIAAARGHERRLGPPLGDQRDLVVRAARLERAGRLELLALQPHLGRAGRLRQLRARLERRVERDPAQALRAAAFDVGERSGRRGMPARVVCPPRALRRPAGRSGVLGDGLGTGLAVDLADRLAAPQPRPHQRAESILDARALDRRRPVAQRVVDLVLVARGRGEQVVDPRAAPPSSGRTHMICRCDSRMST